MDRLPGDMTVREFANTVDLSPLASFVLGYNLGAFRLPAIIQDIRDMRLSDWERPPQLGSEADFVAIVNEIREKAGE